MENDPYDDIQFEERQHNRTLAKEERNWEKTKMLVEKMQRETRENIVEALQDECTRKNLAKEGYQATERYNNGADAGLRGRIDRYVSHGGVFKGYDDEEVITGMEQRPWERD